MEDIKIENVKKKEKQIKKIIYICLNCGKEEEHIKVCNKTNKCTQCGSLNLMGKI